MGTYWHALGRVFGDWKKALLVPLFTIVRFVFGWSWISAGIEKLGWISAVGAPPGQKTPVSNSAGLIGVMIDHLAGPGVSHFDPLHLNNLFAWFAQNLFLSMPRATDLLVVGFELGIGLLIFLGFGVFWAALAALFLNLQFFAAGSFNNFGYVWTDVAILAWAKGFEVVGLGGLVRAKKGEPLMGGE